MGLALVAAAAFLAASDPLVLVDNRALTFGRHDIAAGLLGDVELLRGLDDLVEVLVEVLELGKGEAEELVLAGRAVAGEVLQAGQVLS